MNIEVNLSRLYEVSNEVKNINASLQGTMDEIEQLVLSVRGDWQGEAELAFSEKIIYVKNQFSSISSFFDDYSDLLKSFAVGYEQQEADISAAINLA